MSKQDAISSGLPVYLKLSTDDQDSVRLLTVEDLIVLATHLSPDEVETHLLESLRRSATDKSWRVRYMIASHFVEVHLTKMFPVCLTKLPLSLPRLLGKGLSEAN